MMAYLVLLVLPIAPMTKMTISIALRTLRDFINRRKDFSKTILYRM